MFYTGAAAEEPKKKRSSELENPLENVLQNQYHRQIIQAAQETLRGFAFEELSARKINDYMVDFKHERLGVPYPTLDLTPFAVSQASFAQSVLRKGVESELMDESKLLNTQPEDDELWLSKINNDKTDEELSMFGFSGTQETQQTFDDVFYIIKTLRQH